MANWQYRIELNAAIRSNDGRFDLTRLEEPCPQEALQALADEIKKAPPIARFAPRILDAKSIAEVNRILQKVYDEADRRLVWCGL